MQENFRLFPSRGTDDQEIGLEYILDNNFKVYVKHDKKTLFFP